MKTNKEILKLKWVAEIEACLYCDGQMDVTESELYGKVYYWADCSSCRMKTGDYPTPEKLISTHNSVRNKAPEASE